MPADRSVLRLPFTDSPSPIGRIKPVAIQREWRRIRAACEDGMGKRDCRRAWAATVVKGGRLGCYGDTMGPKSYRRPSHMPLSFACATGEVTNGQLITGKYSTQFSP